MVITTCMVTLIMLVVWKTSIWKVIVFFVVFGVIELIYLSASLYKFLEGGYLPLIFSSVLITIMTIWHYVHRKRYEFEYQNTISTDRMREIVRCLDMNRVPGIGLVYSELADGIPPIFLQFVKKVPSLHSVIIFVYVKSIPISKVAIEERFIFQRLVPEGYGLFRCLVRLGYNDVEEDPAEFQRSLVEHLLEFIRRGYLAHDVSPMVNGIVNGKFRTHNYCGPLRYPSGSTSTQSPNLVAAGSSRKWYHKIEEEVQLVQDAEQSGIVYLLGETKVKAREDASVFKKIVVNHVYDLIRKILRRETVMSIPTDCLLKVGMTYKI